jgi:lipoprotein signal peptidase
VDFIHMYWGSSHWPRYNVADIGITVGVIVLVIATGFKKNPPKAAQAASAPVPQEGKKRKRKDSAG